ncbi:MAG: hypothetical protein GEU90_19280 [Gemmatimonas sp.]|nr:hypothetical protein [Gemmatimonas sp.]
MIQGQISAEVVGTVRAPNLRRSLPALVMVFLLAGAATAASQEEVPTTVQPVFDGWFRNPDGSFCLSFGYYSRSTDRVGEIPLGPNNFIEPAIFDGHQPTHFLPQPQDRGPGRGIRHWGVFTVRVPPDFGDREVRWTLRMNGRTFSVPGHVRHPNYEIDPLAVDTRRVEAPRLRLVANGPVGVGPDGVSAGPINAEVGAPLEVTAWADDETAPPVTLRWFKHQGPGEVVFASRQLPVDPAVGWAATDITFSEPGDYVLRVRATNFATEFDRFCCWTNGYLAVSVSNPD